MPHDLNSTTILRILNLIAAASPDFSSGIQRKAGLTLFNASKLLFK